VTQTRLILKVTKIALIRHRRLELMGRNVVLNGVGSLDPVVRDRVVEHIGPFVDALDEAVASSSADALEDVRTKADELMRAIASVMIELLPSGQAP
jgi:hypothetical protein